MAGRCLGQDVKVPNTATRVAFVAPVPINLPHGHQAASRWLEHGSDPPSPLLYHRLAVGVENGHRFSILKNLGFRLLGRLGDGRRSSECTCSGGLNSFCGCSVPECHAPRQVSKAPLCVPCVSRAR